MGNVVVISFGSSLANGLFTGRRGKPGVAEIVGITGFSKKYQLMEKSANSGCPFAASVLPVVRVRMAEITKAIIIESERVESLPLLIPVDVDEAKKFVHDVTRFSSMGIKTMLHSMVKLDELALIAYKARMGGAISKKQSFSLPEKHKKRIRALMFYCYQYEDYKFRDSTSSANINKWNYMVYRFGEPTVKPANHVV